MLEEKSGHLSGVMLGGRIYRGRNAESILSERDREFADGFVHEDTGQIV